MSRSAEARFAQQNARQKQREAAEKKAAQASAAAPTLMPMAQPGMMAQPQAGYAMAQPPGYAAAGYAYPYAAPYGYAASGFAMMNPGYAGYAVPAMMAPGQMAQMAAPGMAPPPAPPPAPPDAAAAPDGPPPELTDPEAIEEKRRAEIPLHGNAETFNLNPLLYNNIMGTEYFMSLQGLHTFDAIVDEIYEQVTHVEPWATGTQRVPSSAFCLLVKLCTFRVTREQMKVLLTHGDSPHIRLLGFLYLRYATPPAELWAWFAPHLDDEEPVAYTHDPADVSTVGSFARRLLTEQHYHNTVLPRIPVLIERGIKVKARRPSGARARGETHIHTQSEREEQRPARREAQATSRRVLSPSPPPLSRRQVRAAPGLARRARGAASPRRRGRQPRASTRRRWCRTAPSTL